MKSATRKPTSETRCSFSSSPALDFLQVAALWTFLFLAGRVQGQLDVTSDFNNTNTAALGWTAYDPGTGGGQVNSRTFVPDGANGFAYRLFGPPGPQCSTLLNRGGAYRAEQYAEFFQSADLINFDPRPYQSLALLGARIGSPGYLSTSGYFFGLDAGGPRTRQQFVSNLGFTIELNSRIVDAWRGGAATMTALRPSQHLRIAFFGTNGPGNMNNLLTGEIYDPTDLLEPLVRVNFDDAQTGSAHTSGENLLAWLNLDYHERCDFTWDNYHATASRNTPVGFPGTPQVRSLVPAAQTLFYSIPTTNQIAFTATTFTTNQINTSTMKLLLNNVDVSSGLSFTEVRTPLVGSPNTNFTVRWNGTLSSNTVYHGQITLLDTNGKGTTNNWYFDTYKFFDPTDTNNPSGFLLIEAEDYNYNAGQFQDYPPVSGTDDTTTSEDGVLSIDNSDPDPANWSYANPPASEVLGPQVKGGGLGYYNPDGASDIVGTPEVDFHASNTGFNPIEQQQYRSADAVRTQQGTKGGGFDTPRSYRKGLPNNNAGVSYVPDYMVTDMRVGDWLNYTRVFPSNTYNVYLRASSQGRQDVRLDQVTGDRTQPNQTTALKGQFLVPNTASWTRFRYVPLTDAAGNLQKLALSGTNTLRLTANQVRHGNTVGIDLGDLQLNWLLFVPVAPGLQGPYIASALPSQNSESFNPDGTIQIVILNRDTAVVPVGIQLRLDGVNVTGSVTVTNTTSEGPGATVTYRPPSLLLPNSVHTLNMVFGDGPTTQTNNWSFTVNPEVPLLSPSDAVGGLPDAFFSVQMHKANNTDASGCSLVGAFDNTMPRAEHQLSNGMINPDTQAPYENEAANQPNNIGLYTETNAINYDQCGQTDPQVGLFGGDVPYPGMDPAVYCNGSGGTASPDNFAMAATIKLQLAAGVYRMGVNNDDGWSISAGGPGGTNQFLGYWDNPIPGARSSPDSEFEFVVQTSGVYKFRLVHQADDGGGNVEWYWVNRTNGVKTLVTPTPAPSVLLYSSTTVNGSYTNDLTGVIDTGTKTVTVPKSGNTRFYKLSAGSALNITNVTLSGGNVVLKYQ
ncbi:MAG: hypothetical protein HY298_04150 [Verrucomicrobia bacterium]|nr:hypothetical protein [Verrucomicrobiota bacterium]